MSNHHDDQRDAAASEAASKVRSLAESLDMRTAGPFETRADAPAWAAAFIDQFEAASPVGCSHLQRTPTQPSKWLAILPGVLVCQRCEPTLASELAKRVGSDPATSCDLCGRRGPVHTATLTYGQTIIVGLICEGCKAGPT